MKCVVCGSEIEARRSDGYPGGPVIEGYHCPVCGIEYRQPPKITREELSTPVGRPACGVGNG